MRLKRINLFGFKSFADKTEITFDHGVTAVVGPNGCGKSNISDAVRWVLGERSAKMLRGSKMEDVIFSGTQYRKPMALAEVSLTIDNEDRGLPIDYNEVTITRRLYRSGESEYLINKTACRLRDVHDLISDTGIGSNSYSMIEQGRIDYILSANADERRFLIEEAAGISKFKSKKDEALRKLERTEDNRLRLNDIIQEVHKNIQYAERQAKRAEKYKQHFDELKKLEIQKAFLDLEGIENKKGEIQNNKSRLQSEIEELTASIQGMRQAQEKISQTLRGILDRYSEEDTIRHGLQSKIEQIDQQLQFHQEKRMEMASRKGEIIQENKQIEERLSSGRLEIQTKQKEKEALDEDKNIAETALTEAQKTLDGINSEIDALKQQSNELRHQSEQASSKVSMIGSGFHRIEAFLENSKTQKDRRNEAREALQKEQDELKSKQAQYQTELSENQSKLTELEKEITEYSDKNKSTETSLENSRQNSESTRKTLHQAQTRLELLEELDRAEEESLKEILDEGYNEGISGFKALRDLIRVKDGYEWALELALESLAHSFVIQNSSDASRIIEKLKQKKVTALSFFSLEQQSQLPMQMPSAPHNPSAEYVDISLLELLEFETGFENALRPLFENVFVCKNASTESLLQNLYSQSSQYKFVTREGIILGPRKQIHFKNPSVLEKDSVFQRRTEINQLNEMITKSALELEENERKTQEYQKSQIEFQAILGELENQRMNVRLKNESTESFKSETLAQIQKFGQDFEKLRTEDVKSEEEEQNAKKQKIELEESLREAQQAESATRQKAEEIIQIREGFDHKKTDALKRVAECSARFESIDERDRLLVESLSYLLEHVQTSEERLESLKDEVNKINEKDAELQEKDTNYAIEKTNAEEKRRASEITLELIRKEKTKAEQELSETLAALESLQEKERKAQDESHKSEMKSMDLDYQKKTIHERLQQTYHLNLGEFNREDYTVTDEEKTILFERIEKLSKRVDSIGTVNLLAIEEYDELKERYDFLMKQQNDLEEARTQLLETIRKINKTTRSLFEETFQAVQVAFGEYYQTLFKGGMAQLVLVDESNPLESGIDILVRPPGKKVQHISLLSGGEKALTAIALLFSLFKIKPSPFCVLDEVDAPLDEANIDRFLGVLQSFLKTSQFIIVTHNRKTIAMGDSLYGVTMQEAGVSKLVSVKVAQEEIDKEESTSEKEPSDKATTPASEDDAVTASDPSPSTT